MRLRLRGALRGALSISLGLHLHHLANSDVLRWPSHQNCPHCTAPATSKNLIGSECENRLEFALAQDSMRVITGVNANDSYENWVFAECDVNSIARSRLERGKVGINWHAHPLHTHTRTRTSTHTHNLALHTHPLYVALVDVVHHIFLHRGNDLLSIEQRPLLRLHVHAEILEVALGVELDGLVSVLHNLESSFLPQCSRFFH